MTLNLKASRHCHSIYYIVVVIRDLDNGEMDTEIFPIARVQPDKWKVTQNSTWPWIWRSNTTFAVLIISELGSVTLIMWKYRHRDFSNSPSTAGDMKGHANELVTLNLKVNRYCHSSRGSSNLSSTWSRVNAQMRTSLPSPSTLSSLPLIDRVCAAKACPGRDTNSPLTLCECCRPGYWYFFR